MALISIQNYANDAGSLFQRPSDTWTLPISNLYGQFGYKKTARLAYASTSKQMTLRVALPVNSGLYEFSRARVLFIGGLNCLAGTSIGLTVTGFKTSAALLANTGSVSFWNSGGGIAAPGYARAWAFELPDSLVYDSINDEPIEFLSVYITFTSASGVTFADIGKVWIGPGFEVTQDANWVAPMDFGSTVAVSPGGRAQRSLGKMTRRLSLPISYLERAQVVTNVGLRQRLAIAGMNREMVVIPSRESIGFIDAGSAYRSEFGIFGYIEQNSVDFTRTETTDWGARFGVTEFVP